MDGVPLASVQYFHLCNISVQDRLVVSELVTPPKELCTCYPDTGSCWGWCWAGAEGWQLYWWPGKKPAAITCQNKGLIRVQRGAVDGYKQGSSARKCSIGIFSLA